MNCNLCAMCILHAIAKVKVNRKNCYDYEK